ncbi:MAG TPA: enoyl-CoA hydratase/isomerase family protein [Candidatus Dormibacteraeota bacterium]
MLATRSPDNPVRLEIGSGIAEIILNRPPLNVLDIDALRQLNEALTACRSSGIRVVLIRSALERAFSAGVDVRDHTRSRLPAMLAEVRKQAHLLLTLESVTVAAVHGSTLGGGAELALLCDEVIAADDMRLGFPEITLGAFPPVAAALLPQQSPARTAMRLLLGEVVPAALAEQLGLLTRVVPRAGLDESAHLRVQDLAALSGVAVHALVRAVRGARAVETLHRLDAAIAAYEDLVGPSADAQEGIDAFLEKRSPAWSHR